MNETSISTRSGEGGPTLSRLLASEILARCAQAAGMTRERLLAPRGGRSVERTRQATLWAAQQLLEGTGRGRPVALGRIFQRHHATILHNLKQANRLIVEDDDFQTLAAGLLERASRGSTSANVTPQLYNPRLAQNDATGNQGGADA